MKTPYILSLAILCIAGCTIGGNITKLHVAQNPEGERLKIQTFNNLQFFGEFLALNEESITILIDAVNTDLSKKKDIPIELPSLSQINLKQIQSVLLIHSDKKIMSNGKFIENHKISYQHYSRYPQGINNDLMGRLLEAYEQDSLYIVSL